MKIAWKECYGQWYVRIAWKECYGQWYVRIGYCRSKSGNRVRKTFYLGKERKAAEALATKLRRLWRSYTSRQDIPLDSDMKRLIEEKCPEAIRYEYTKRLGLYYYTFTPLQRNGGYRRTSTCHPAPKELVVELQTRYPGFSGLVGHDNVKHHKYLYIRTDTYISKYNKIYKYKSQQKLEYFSYCPSKVIVCKAGTAVWEDIQI